jgi:hypothetical protein
MLPVSAPQLKRLEQSEKFLFPGEKREEGIAKEGGNESNIQFTFLSHDETVERKIGLESLGVGPGLGMSIIDPCSHSICLGRFLWMHVHIK